MCQLPDNLPDCGSLRVLGKWSAARVSSGFGWMGPRRLGGLC